MHPPSLVISLLAATSHYGHTKKFLDKKNNKKTLGSFPHIAFSCCEPRNRENSCLRVFLSRPRRPEHKKNEWRIIIVIKIMFAARMMQNSAAPTTTTHNQNKTQNFHPKRTAFRGIRRRRCRLPLIAMSIPQQGGNAQPRESHRFLSVSLSRLLVFLVFAH